MAERDETTDETTEAAEAAEPAEAPLAAETPVAAEPAADVEADVAAAEAPAPGKTKKTEKKRLPRPLRSQRAKPVRAGKQPGERKLLVRQPKPEAERGSRQERRGVVVSSAMDKTIVVRVETLKVHPRYKKVIRRSQKFRAHDEENTAKIGDVVRIVETRPLSKTKNWRLAQVLEEAR